MKEAVVIILAGQSNAVGVGHTAYLPRHFSPDKVAELRAGYPRVQINYHSHDKKSGGFVPVTLGCTERTKDTLGPEVGLAERLTACHPEQEYFIIKCAVGATSLWRDWLSPSSGGDYDPEARAQSPEAAVDALMSGKPLAAGWCYNELVRLTQESLDALTARGYAPHIRGFCWMQGEADAELLAHTERYGERYGNLLRDFTARFGAYMEGCVFADGGISEVWPLYREMNAVKADLAAARDDCVYIDTVAHGLTTGKEPEGEVDIFHYDSDSVVALGRLFAEALGLG